MTAINNTDTFSDAHSPAAAQKGSIVLLAVVIAFVRAAMVIVSAVTLGGAARYFFPEMFAIPNSPVALLAVVAIDTFAIAAGVLTLRSKANAAKTH